MISSCFIVCILSCCCLQWIYLSVRLKYNNVEGGLSVSASAWKEHLDILPDADMIDWSSTPLFSTLDRPVVRGMYTLIKWLWINVLVNILIYRMRYTTCSHKMS